MALPDDEWLHFAKRAPVGGTGRHHHGRERRPNLVVRNLDDRYTAYCMACKQGAVRMKEHVRVTGIAAPVLSTDLTLPHDMCTLELCSPDVQFSVLAFLAKKNMDRAYIDGDVFFSQQRMRVLVQWDGGWLGRDTTERSTQKWLTFNQQRHLAARSDEPTAIVVEDPFSFYKVRWALRGLPYSVYSSLGTMTPDELIIKLLCHDTVVYFYDGDKAGYAGSTREAKRIRAMGVPAMATNAPLHLDPKDMSIEEIRGHFSNG